MKLEILEKIKAEFGVDAVYYDQGLDEQGYFYWDYGDDPDGLSEWDVEGRLMYSTHGFKIHENYLK